MVGELSVDLSEQIIAAIRKIETIYGKSMDIEWAIRGNELYILQARSITTVNKIKVTEKNLYIDSLAIDELEQYDISVIRKAHKKYMEKHYRIRKKALDAGLFFPDVGYFLKEQKNIK